MRRHETWIALLLLCAVGCGVDGLRGSELVLAAKAKAAEEKLNPTTEIITVVNENGTNVTVTKPLLTGIPQIDYIYDPNLPRELNGHNLSDYPFLNAVPPNIDFACDGLHDGFYASVLHKCQLYHHCLFGTRYDFLCANYTAFDQKTFICHFVSEVDCKNSANYFIRNEALYKQDTTAAPSTTKAPTTTTTTTTTTEAPHKKGGRRRRPYRRRRPVYEYYYDEEEEGYDDEYYDDDIDPPPRKANRRQQRPSDDVLGGRRDDPTTTTTTTTSTTTAAPASADAPLTRAPLSVYAPRALPKIKRPVPLNEKSKYDYTTKGGAGVPAPTSNPKDGEDDEYYYDDEEYDEPQPPPSKRKESGKNGRRRSQHSERKRPIRYDDEYEDEIEEEEERPRMRKGNNRKDDDFRPRNRGSQGKSKKGQREEEEAIPSERPGYISPARGGSRKRHQEVSRPERRRPDRRPGKGYDYYDEEEPEDDSRYSDDRRRPNNRNKNEKSRPRPKKPTTTTTTTTSTTTSTTTTTTPRPTPAPTTAPPASYEDEEYEEYEYEDDIILDPKTKPKVENRKEIPQTTSAPHRFSTTGYRTQRLPSPAPTTTTEQPPRRGTPAVPTFRSRKPDYRRPPNTDEPYSSQVGTPTGFKRPEEDNSKVKSSDVNNRGSYEDGSQRVRGSEFPSRRPVTGTGSSFSSEDLVSRRQVKPESSQPVDPKPPTNRQEYPIPPTEVKPQGDSQGFFIRKPFKPQFNSFSSKYSDDSSQRRPESYNAPVSGPSSLSAEDDLSYRKPQQVDSKLSDLGETSLQTEDKKQRIEYPVSPPQITQGPPLPSAPQSPYRRPYVPTGPEGPRRPSDESQFRRQKPDPFASSGDDNLRRPFPSSAEANGNKEDEQSYRRPQKPSYSSTGPEAFRRPSGPDGTSKSSVNNRRGARPEKEPKKTLEELAYPSRRAASTQEPVTEPGPNYRNPFLSARPVVEDQDYYKVNKEPALDFTAPGPSNDGSTPRSLSSYDIGEEYDVTLNDALQPSTLNPTVQYSRVKTRGYQSAVTHPSYRSILIPAASQNYYSKTAVADQMEYETVVLPTARFTQAQARYKTPRRPNDWSYW